MRRGAAPAFALALALPALPVGACAIDPYTTSAYPESLVQDSTTGRQLARAWLDHPTGIYDHHILGRTTEPDLLYVQFAPDSSTCGSVIEAGKDHVFEDLAPRLADVDGDGENEVIVVRSSLRQGAQLAVYGSDGRGFGLVASTDYIGAPHRWLAPAGIADFDGDGQVEIAYVDRPHLLADLVYVRKQGKRLVEIARLPGVTNHRIGDAVILGGLRDCGQGPELVLASKDWSRLMIIGWTNGPVARDAGPWSRAAEKAAIACR